MALLLLQGAFATAVPSAWNVFLPISAWLMSTLPTPTPAYTAYINKQRETVFLKKKLKGDTFKRYWL